MPSGMRTACATNCAAMCWPTSPIRTPWWPSTRPAFPSGEPSRQARRINIVAAPNIRETCQVGVFLSYISSRGHTLLDRELYLPRHWLADRARCEKVGIPETVGFPTKRELGRRDDA